jgi:hypothetical protein
MAQMFIHYRLCWVEPPVCLVLVANMQGRGQRGTYQFSQVYDSGDDLEQISKDSLGLLYNSEGKESQFDSRSKNKGKSQTNVLFMENELMLPLFSSTEQRQSCCLKPRG